MAVLGRLLVGSGERLDLADLLSLDSYTASDFKYLIQSFIGASKPYVLYGLDVISPQDAIGTENISIRIANSVVYFPGSKAGSFYYGLEEGNINAQPLIPELRKNATNFVYLTFSTFDTAKDSRAFWDPDQNGGEGGEFSQDVNTETALKLEVNVSVSTFPENTIPICKVVVGPSVITSIQDCRDQFFRLGTGGIAPDPFSTYSFREDPSSTYSRLEPSTTMTSALNPNPFQGGDKNIRTLKEWMDVVMTRIKELGGTTYWYEGSSTVGPNINNVFLDALGSTIKSKGEWQHSGSVAGEATWTEDIHYYSLIDSRDLIVRANTITLPSSDKVAWININREADFNGIAATVDWQNGVNYVNGAVGAFANLSVGDWVKKSSDSSTLFLRVEQLNSGTSLAGSSTTAALAQSIALSGNYAGLTGTEVGKYTQGEYVLTDINITDRNDPSIAAAGGNFFWLAYRSDTSLGLSSAVSTSLTLDITEADGERAKVTSTSAHGLIDGDHVYIASGPYAGTYMVEYESSTVFSIKTTVTGDSLGISGYYGIVTTAARSTSYGYALETANHGFKSGEEVFIAGASPWDGSYTVNYRTATTFQIAVTSGLATTGPVAGEIVNLARLNVRTEFGTVKVVQGETANIGDMDSKNILSFIGMDSLAETSPNYSIPGAYNALNGYQNYNSLSTDSLTTRVSRLTAMMADRVQDRGMQIIGRTNLVSVTNGANQEISALANLTLKRPGSADLTINLTSAVAIPANSVAVIDIDRDGSGSITPTVESWGINSLISENKIILFYRFSDTTVYTWDNSAIDPSGHLNLHKPEDAQNRNIWAFNPGQVYLNGSGLLTLDVKQVAEITEVTALSAASVPQSSYFTFYAAYDTVGYYVWYNKDGLGIDPAVVGKTGIQVNITTGDTDAQVATATASAINIAAAADVTASSLLAVLTITNDLVGPATDAANGAGLLSTTFPITVVTEGFDPDIQIFISGSANNNTIDVDAINTLATLVIQDGQSAWVRVNRFAAKTFNTVAFADLPDTDVAGKIYVTNYANIPVDQDVFVLWSRVGNNILETHFGQRPDGNVYDETFNIRSTSSGDYQIAGPITAGTILNLPLDSRDNGNIQEYVVGSGQLELYLNGQYLVNGVDWSEVGTDGSMSRRFYLNQDLVVDDDLTLRIDAHGAVYFAASAGGGGTLQDAYDGGRFISVTAGLPVTLTGTPGTKLLSIQGDMEVTGVIDPAAITFSQEASDPLGATDYGLWRNASDELIYKRGTDPELNISTDFIRRDGTHTMLADLDLNSNKIINLAAPTSADDAVRKTDLDTAVSTIGTDFIKRDGTNTMLADLNLNNFVVTDLAAPVNPNDATRKTYVDSNFLKLDGTNPMAAALNMGSFKIGSLAAGTLAADAVRYDQVMLLSGTNVMAAALDMGTHKITNLVDPTAPQEAATKNYVDTSGKDKILTLYTNNTGSTIAAGTVVYVDTSGNQIGVATASSFSASKGTIGVAAASIADGASGYVQVKGRATVIGSISAGNVAYLSATPGQATTTPPSTTGYSLVVLGVATSSTEVELGVQFIKTLDNPYDESYTLVSGAPSNDYELTGPISASSSITLPLDSRNGGASRNYIVGSGVMQVYLNGDKLRVGDDWSEVGSLGSLSSSIITNIDLAIGDFLTFVIQLNGSTVLTGGGGGGGEANTASNLGSGAQIFKQKVGVDLQLRSITTTSGLSATQGTNSIALAAKLTVRSISATDTALDTDDLILIDASGGAVTLNLPAASAVPGKVYYAKKTDASANNMIIDPNASDTIDGVPTKTSNVQNETLTFVSDGATTWWLI